MTVGAGAEVAQVVDVLSSALEQLRSAASMLAPDEIWKCSGATVERVLLLRAEIDAASCSGDRSAPQTWPSGMRTCGIWPARRG